MNGELFSAFADAVRHLGKTHGYDVHVSERSQSITLSKQTRGRSGSEQDFSVKVREIPVPPKPPRQTKAQLERELTAEKARSERLRRERDAARHSDRERDFSYFGLGDGPT